MTKYVEPKAGLRISSPCCHTSFSLFFPCVPLRYSPFLRTLLDIWQKLRTRKLVLTIALLETAVPEVGFLA